VGELKDTFNPKDPSTYIVPELLSLAVPIDSCQPHPKNPRVHDDRSIKALMKSIREFKQDQPIVVHKETGYIIKGNGRWLAMKELKCSHIAAIMVSETELKALKRGVVDNRTQELSQWHLDYLGEILRDWLKSEPIDPIFWGGDDLQAMLSPMEITPADVENLNPIAVAAATYQPDAFDDLDLRSVQSPHRDAILKGYLVILYTLDKEKGRDLMLAFSLRPLSKYKDKEVQRRVSINITGLEDEVINRLAFLMDVLSAKADAKKSCKRKCEKPPKSSDE
jgi:hypothetical protein